MDAIVEFLGDFGMLGMFIHGMIDAIIFPIPAFFTQISLSAVHPENALWLATVGFVGCLLGTPIGYGIGKVSGHFILNKIMSQSLIDKATNLFNKHGEAAILFGAFTPVPFKIFTILAGVMEFSLWRLLAYAFIGRAGKFYIVGVLFYFYGKAAENMMGTSFILAVLAIGVVVVSLWLVIRQFKHKNDNNEEETKKSETKVNRAK